MSFSKLLFLSLVLFCFVGISACDWENGDTRDVIVPRTVADSLFITTSTGLMYYDIEAGEGDIITQDKDYVTVNYALWTYPQTIFVESGAFPFELGSGIAIDGFDEGVHGMKKNGERQMIVPSNLAYGSGDLMFEIQVTEIDTTRR